jgi:dUTP pyrophosphatase
VFLKKIIVKIKRLNSDAVLPTYQTSGSSGMDLRSTEILDIGINEIKLVSTGIAVAVPEGYEAQVRSRSGLALKGVFVLNSPGTIDQDYRGEVKVILANFGSDFFHIEKGDRIAQLVIVPVVHAESVEVDNLDSTVRGGGGFGSTGIE